MTIRRHPISAKQIATARATLFDKQVADFMAAHNGVKATGNMPQDFALMKAGKTLWTVGSMTTGGRGAARKAVPVIRPAYQLLVPFDRAWTYDQFLSAWNDMQRSIAAQSSGFFKSFVTAATDVAKESVKAPIEQSMRDVRNVAKAVGVKLPTRAQALKVGRVAAVVVAIYFAAPYLAAAASQAGAYATAAEQAIGTEASALVSAKLKQAAAQKLMQHFAHGTPPPVAPQASVAPVASAAAPGKLPKPAALTLSAALPFLAFLII